MLLSLMLLCSNLITTASADNTYYFPVEGQIQVQPTVAPEVTPAPVISPLLAVADDITLAVSPAADSALVGAAFAAERITDDAVLESARTAFANAFGADSATPGTEMRLIRLHFSQNENAIPVPAGLTVEASAPVNGSFTPVRGLALKAQGDTFACGEPAAVQVDQDTWSAAITLPDTDLLLLMGRAASVAPETTPETTPAVGELAYEDEAIQLTATLSDGSVPAGTTLSVAPVELSQPADHSADTAAETSADAATETNAEAVAKTPEETVLFGYRVTLLNAAGEPVTDASLALHLTLRQDVTRLAASALTAGENEMIWQRGAEETAASPETFDFTLPSGGTFQLTGIVTTPEPTAAPTTEPAPASFDFENDAMRLNLALADGSALPAGTQLNAILYRADWAEYSAALSAQGLTEDRVAQIVRIGIDFALEGNPVDAGTLPVTWNLFLKGDPYQGAETCLLLSGDTATPVSDFAATAEGATLTVNTMGETELVLAMILPKPTEFQFENDDVSLTVTLPDAGLLPNGAQLTASVTAAPWAELADRLLAQGVDETHLLKAVTVTPAFILNGEPVDLGDAALAYRVALKGTQTAKTLYRLTADAAQPAAGFAVGEAGAETTDTVTAGARITLAAVLPPSAVYTFENDLIRLTVTVPDASLVPEGAKLVADATPATWAEFADRLQAKALEETDAKQTLRLSVGFEAEGAPVDLGAVPLTYEVLVKGEQTANLSAWVLDAQTATLAQSVALAEEGTDVVFAAPASAELGLALMQAKSATFTYEDDAYRLTVTVPDAALLPEGTQLNASIADGVWDDYAYRLQAQGFDETRVKKLLRMNVTLTQGDAPVALEGVPIGYTLLFKGAQYENQLAWALLKDQAVTAESLTPAEEGTTAAFTATDETDLGLAVTLPGRTVYTYEDDQIYVVATLSDPAVIPEGAQFLVSPMVITDQMQPYLDMLKQATNNPAAPEAASAAAVEEIATQEDATATDTTATDVAADAPAALPAQTETGAATVGQPTTQTYTGYNIRFELDGVEYEPQEGAVSIAITSKVATMFGANVPDMKVLHLKEEDGQINPEILDASVNGDSTQGGDTLKFNTTGFSGYVIPTDYKPASYLHYYHYTSTPPSNPPAGALYATAYTNDTRYYNSTRPLGIAGNFHIVAFGTATLGAHTNGNILANALEANRNFGTDKLTNELSYISHYMTVHPTSGSSTDHVLAVGSNHDVSLYLNGTNFTLKESSSSNDLQKLDRPYNLYQDDSSVDPYINLDQVKKYVQNTSNRLAAYDTSGTDVLKVERDEDQDCLTLTLLDKSKGGVFNTTAQELSNYSNDIKMKGISATKGGTIIINVDCQKKSAITLPQRVYEYLDEDGGSRHGLSNETKFNTNRTLWNFYNGSGTLTLKEFGSSVIALGMSVDLTSNFNGTVIAQNVTVSSESHRDDFIGDFPSGTTTTSMSVSKAWLNADDSPYEGLKPATITVKLFRSDDAKNANATATLNAGNSYTCLFDKLPLFAPDGSSYTYEVKEVVPDGFLATPDIAYPTSTTALITNKLQPVNITVNKTWLDTATAHPNVTVTLKRIYAGGTLETLPTTKTLSSSTSPAWTATFSNYPAGVYVKVNNVATYKAYTYSVVETEPTGYHLSETVTNSATSFTLKNTPDTMDVTVDKHWVGDTGTDSVTGKTYDYTDYRNTGLSLTLKRWYDTSMPDNDFTKSVTFTNTTGSDWSALVTGLAKGFYTYSSGSYSYHLYTYYVVEGTVPPGYTPDTVNDLSVTNTFQTKRVQVIKNWKDDANRDGTAEAAASGPAISIKVKYPDGITLADSGSIAANATGNALTWVSKPLPKYPTGGTTEIAYQILEDAVTGYNTVLGGSTAYTNGQSFTITNTRIRIPVTVTKQWVDSGYGSDLLALTRPSVTYTLYGSNSTIAADTVTLVSGLANYNHTFTYLPKYTTGGTLITYSVVETLNPTGNPAYTVAYSGLTATNTLKVTSVSGEKTWKNPNGTDYTGYKPAATIRLWQTDNSNTKRLFKTAPFAANAGDYGYSFTGLPLYDATGKSYTYSVDEVAVPHFQSAVSGYSVTNTLESTEVPVTKNWNDNGYQGEALTRPQVTVYLTNGVDRTTADHNAGQYTFGGITGTSEAHTFQDLPTGYFSDSGVYNAYTYSVNETSPFKGYELISSTGSATAGFVLTNRLITTSVSVTKNWVLGAHSNTGVPKVVVFLKRDGTVIDRHELAATATPQASYQWSWDNLPTKNPFNGNTYSYAVAEVIDPTDSTNAPGTGVAAGGFDAPEYTGNGTGTVILTNRQHTVSLNGQKYWHAADDSTYPSGAHTPAFSVTLYQGNNKYLPEQTVPFAMDATVLTYQFTGLPERALNGTLYSYSVRESSVTGFDTSYPSGTNNVVNHLKPISVTVAKTWGDGSAARQVTVKLTRQAEGASVWEDVPGYTSLSFTGSTTVNNLPAGVVNANGVFKAYAYSAVETGVNGYTPSYQTVTAANGNQTVTVTNDRNRVSFVAQKLWRNVENNANITPPTGAQVTLQLMKAEGAATPVAVEGVSVVLDGTVEAASSAYESAAWVATFTNLEEYTPAGVQNHYSVVETASVNANGFWTLYVADATNHMLVKNLQTRLVVKKVSSLDSLALDGATFTITNVATAETFTITDSGASGKWTLDGQLKPDVVYELAETVAPVGYLIADPVRFRISGANGNVYTRDGSGNYSVLCADHQITVKDEPIDLKLVKLNTNTGNLTPAQQAALPAASYVTGATLRLYRKDAPTDNPQTITVNNTGLIVLDSTHLIVGKTYVLEETVTPAGYQTADPMEITLGAGVNSIVYSMFDNLIDQKTFEVQKTWSTGTAGADVVFVLKRGGVEVTRVTLPKTDADGLIAFPGTYPMTDSAGLAYVYTVEELPVDGYVVTSAMQKLSETDTNVRYGITNAPVVVNVSKRGLDTSNTLMAGEVPGAQLKITDNLAPSVAVDAWTSTGEAHQVSGKLIVGHTYTLSEVTAPLGFAPVGSMQFTVNSDGSISAVGTLPADVYVFPGATASTIKLKDRQLTLSVSKQAAGGGSELPLASLTLKDTTANQTVATWTSGNVAKTFTSTVSSTAPGTQINGLYYTMATDQQYPLVAGHTYSLLENAAPAGYLLTNQINFTLNANNTVTLQTVNGTAVASGSTVTLYDALNSFVITKTNADSAPLPGAEFAIYLYNAAATDHLGNKVYPDAAVTPVPQTDANGRLTVYGLTNGAQYVLVETKAPAGYTLAAPYEFTYQDGQATSTQPGHTVTDTLASLKLRKVGPDNTPVAGSTLAIYNQAKTKKWTYVSIAGTPQNPEGWITVNADAGQTDASQYLVPGGTYYLHEEAAPDGYVLREDYVSFVFSTGAGQQLSFTDPKLSLTVSKLDIAGGAEIIGATLSITDDTDSGRLVDTWQSDGTVHTVLFTQLRAGHEYTLTETTAPAGFTVAENVRFKIANDGTVTRIGSEGTVSGHNVAMTDDHTKLTLHKTGVNGAALTANLGFTLYLSDIDGNQGAQVGVEGTAFEKTVHRLLPAQGNHRTHRLPGHGAVALPFHL